MDDALPFDPEFRAALRYYLEQRGWTNQEFCERTRPAPSSVSDWCKRSHPSNRAVMIVCQTLGVPRSQFFDAGERLHQVEQELASRSAAAAAERDDPG